MLSFVAGAMPAIYVAMQQAGAAAQATGTGAAPVVGTAPAATAAAPTGIMGLLGSRPEIMIFGLIAVWYFLLIRPQMKQRREEEEARKNIKKGDEVVTSGGLIGKVAGIADDVVTIELQEKVRVKVLRSHVQGKPPAKGDAAAPPASSVK